MKFGSTPVEGRFATIDGLRGMLGLFVFLHHACVWYFYLHTGRWDVPPSNLYTHFGQTSVALFFMITGFLFFTKLIEARGGRVDWTRLFVSRFLRLAPLYFGVVALVFAVVFVLSRGELNQPLSRLLPRMLSWLAFTVWGGPDLNGVDGTWRMVAGVTWSLVYEWRFYLSLPLLALVVGLSPPRWYLVLALVCVALASRHPSIHYLAFLGGIAAALLARWQGLRQFAAGRTASLAALGCLVVAVAAFPSAYDLQPLLLATVFFVLVASGTTLFGLLLSRAARTLGDFAYGIYLMHGITLFITFNFVLGLPLSRALTPALHWALAVALTPVLVFLCFLAFRFIEHPGMRRTDRATAGLRRLFRSRPKAAVVPEAPVPQPYVK